MNTLFSQWKKSRLYQSVVRYKLYHIVFWVGLQLFYTILFNQENIFTWSTILYIIMVSVAQGVGAYLNIYY
ncbi:MAG: hypothetical protein WBA23_03520, partial [Tunicatimonas sp.]|uniref:hypothetical protein n=1 Tax=Tunicatimonas sp. TaxID=1940096 RepID=UPI003C75F727